MVIVFFFSSIVTSNVSHNNFKWHLKRWNKNMIGSKGRKKLSFVQETKQNTFSTFSLFSLFECRYNSFYFIAVIILISRFWFWLPLLHLFFILQKKYSLSKQSRNIHIFQHCIIQPTKLSCWYQQQYVVCSSYKFCKIQSHICCKSMPKKLYECVMVFTPKTTENAFQFFQ